MVIPLWIFEKYHENLQLLMAILNYSFFKNNSLHNTVIMQSIIQAQFWHLISGAAFLNWNFGKNNCIALLAKVLFQLKNVFWHSKISQSEALIIQIWHVPHRTKAWKIFTNFCLKNTPLKYPSLLNEVVVCFWIQEYSQNEN